MANFSRLCHRKAWGGPSESENDRGSCRATGSRGLGRSLLTVFCSKCIDAANAFKRSEPGLALSSALSAGREFHKENPCSGGSCDLIKKKELCM